MCCEKLRERYSEFSYVGTVSGHSFTTQVYNAEIVPTTNSTSQDRMREAVKFGTPGGTVLGPDMKHSMGRPNIDKFPSASDFKDYESFRQAWEKNSTKISEALCDTFLPVP